MKKNEYLALVALEECSEVQQALAKGMRFGFEDTHPERSSLTNGDEVLIEFYQLTAMIEELQQKGLLKELSSSDIADIKQRKLAKVDHYMAYSAGKGILEN